jgi:riboflavin kinase/FMN adenylyltransferase
MKMITGTITHGEGWGRKLGFPTANLRKPTTRKLPLPDGIYAAWARIGKEKKERKAILLMGAPAFFHAKAKKVEVYLVGFRGNLYGKRVRVRPVKKLRRMKRFVNAGALIHQITRDIKEAKKALAQ